jgi:Spherulation-specific family 4
MLIHRTGAVRLGLRKVVTAVAVTALGGPGATCLAPAAAYAQSATAQHIGVPAYFNPDADPGSSYWTQLDQGAPSVGIAIANPDSGPGSAFDQGYANAVQTAANSGVKVIGYVDTGYFGTTGRTTRGGQTSASAWTAQIEGDVTDWYNWYGSYGLAGIFFDDAQNVCGTNNEYVDLYTSINTYTKQNYPGALTADNPGAGVDQCYAQAADILVTFEGTYASYTSWTPPSWELNANNPDEFWNLVYDTPSQADMEATVSQSQQNDVGYIYVTPGALPNPWDTLPTGAYWSDELSQTGASSSAVEARHRGA